MCVCGGRHLVSGSVLFTPGDVGFLIGLGGGEEGFKRREGAKQGDDMSPGGCAIACKALKSGCRCYSSVRGGS